MDAPQETAHTPGAPFACPACGSTDEWKADYYEAVWQTVSLTTGEDGAPVFGDYTGVTGSYDDGSTEDESYRCSACDHEINLGWFVLVPVDVSPHHLASVPPELRETLRAALEGDSNDAEHDALVELAQALGVDYRLVEGGEPS